MCHLKTVNNRPNHQAYKMRIAFPTNDRCESNAAYQIDPNTIYGIKHNTNI